MRAIPRPSDLPDALTSLHNWVGWRNETPEGSSRVTKVPYNLATGTKASSTDPSHWIEYPVPPEIPDEYDGIGFVLTKEVGIVGIDLDDCLNPGNGVIKPWAKDLLLKFGQTYCEISPSGTGIKIFAGGSLPGGGRKVFVDSRGTVTVQSESDGAIEMYDTGRYFTVTGKCLGPLEIPSLQIEVVALYYALKKSSAAKPDRIGGEVVPEGSRHNYLLGMAGRLRNEGFDRSGLLAALRTANTTHTSGSKPDREVVGIVDYIMQKPPKYRLAPVDFERSAAAVNVGTVVEMPASAPKVEVAPSAPPDILSYAEDLLATAIKTKDPLLVLGVGTQPSELILALAQAGTIKQHEARRRIKNAFGIDVPLREFDARIKKSETELRAIADTACPYILTAEGGMVSNLANTITMLQELPIAFNCFTFRPFLTAPAPWGTSGDWSDYDDARATEWCQRKNLNTGELVVASAVNALARSRQPHFHPVRHYLSKLKWDGELRINSWLERHLGVVPGEYTSAVSRKWMISAVKRVMEPGCQADYTLVLEGNQGKRKSTALRALTGEEWFSDDLCSIESKDSALQLQGKWILELAELDAFRRTEMTTVKAWLVRRKDRFRPPYGRRADDFPRQNVFAASTNKEDWGLDDTGLRRFWPVVVGDIDVEGIAASRDQLWAEAMFCYSEGELSYLTQNNEAKAAEEQHARQYQDAWRDSIEQWAAAPSGSVSLRSSVGRIYLPEILQYCLNIPQKDWSQMQKNRVTRVLRLAGYVPKRASRSGADEHGIRPEFWVRQND